MNIKAKLILATTAVALLAAPASARFDGDEGAASAYPRFNGVQTYMTDAASAYASGSTVQPRAGFQRQQRARNPRPQR